MLFCKVKARLNWTFFLTLSRIVCLIPSLSSSCFLYFSRLSFSASLIASCLNLSCSCCSSLLVPLPSSLSPPTPGMLSENSQRLSKNVIYDMSSVIELYVLTDVIYGLGEPFNHIIINSSLEFIACFLISSHVWNGVDPRVHIFFILASCPSVVSPNIRNAL